MVYIFGVQRSKVKVRVRINRADYLFQPDCLHGLLVAQRYVLVFRYLFS